MTRWAHLRLKWPDIYPDRDGPHRITKSAQEPNGMKLTSELLRDQLLTPYVSGFDHQGEGLGSSLLDARLHPMRSGGVDEQRSSRYLGARRAEPAQGIPTAAPFHLELLEPGCWAHHPADEVVDDGQEGQFLQHAWHGLTGPHVHRPGGLEMCRCGFNLPTRAVQFGAIGHAGAVRVEERGHERDLAGPEPRPAPVVAHLAADQGLWQGRPGLPGEP
jgi:hypothetical protein